MECELSIILVTRAARGVLSLIRVPGAVDSAMLRVVDIVVTGVESCSWAWCGAVVLSLVPH